MKNMSIVSAFLGLVILWAGCGGHRTVVTPAVTPAPPDVPSTPQATVPESKEVPVPDWFINIPTDPDHLYAVATVKGRDLGLTSDSAKLAAQTDIAGQMGTKITGLFKRFMEETGTGEDSKLETETAAISQAVVSEVINGCRTAKQKVGKEDVSFRVYVLMEMPIGMANATLMNKIKANKSMYTRFRASQAFQELDAEVEKYEKSKKELGENPPNPLYKGEKENPPNP